VITNGQYHTNGGQGTMQVLGMVAANSFRLNAGQAIVAAAEPSERFIYDASMLWQFRNLLGTIKTKTSEEVAP
jgi:hypothetical protein